MAAERAIEANEALSLLPLSSAAELGTSTTPPEAIKEVSEKLKKGETPTRNEVIEVKRKHKKPAPAVDIEVPPLDVDEDQSLPQWVYDEGTDTECRPPALTMDQETTRKLGNLSRVSAIVSHTLRSLREEYGNLTGDYTGGNRAARELEKCEALLVAQIKAMSE